ncbi:MAG TPA: hypothetical protein PKO15_05440 [Fibrobacteria bacterium]|nr:hypothetical protein [Fibrobacteria bacterium]
MMKFPYVLLLAIGLAVSHVGAAVPVTFQAGSLAKATEVNANFAYLDSVIRAQAGQIASLSGALKDLQTKASADSLSLSRRIATDSSALAELVLRSLPVGSVMGSMVTPSADGSLPGSNGAWILAAGQDPVGGVNIPDLRGVFLRGIDYIVTGRKETGRDSTAARKPGVFQGDAIQDHAHLNGATDDLAAAFPRGASAFSGTTLHIQNENAETSSYEGRTSNVIASSARATTETRPKNVAVYWYIKVK